MNTHLKSSWKNVAYKKKEEEEEYAEEVGGVTEKEV